MTNRPSGKSTTDMFDGIMAVVARERRLQIINETITEDFGVESPKASDRLRWGLQQMKLRGWRNDDWGLLMDNHGKMGDGPICLLESISAGIDSPNLTLETVEQYYLRLAFVELGEEVPVYLSTWNDEQTEFAPIERIMLKAIELAAADEAEGIVPNRLDRDKLWEKFGITRERVMAVQEPQVK